MDNTVKGVEIDSVREKLIKLLDVLIQPGKQNTLGEIADYFIANDVTIQKHGRWIVHNKGQNNWVECSECNTVGSLFWKRCPMCEAKMDL